MKIHTILSYVLLLCICISCKTLSEATVDYNEAVNKYNVAANKYNAISPQVDVSIVNDLTTNYPEIATVNTDKESIKKAILNGNSIWKIKKDIKTLHYLTQLIERNKKVITKLVAPKENWVIDHIIKVPDIEFCKPVTTKKDPNKLLNTKTGYKSCIYFHCNDIQDNSVTFDNILDKGTDAGGCIEIFKTVEDAQARCKYLSQFKGTILDSGLYVILGTMVIRTSVLMSNEEQFRLTEAIVNVFISDED